MTDEQLLIEANRLCRALADHQGYARRVGHKFHTDPNPRAQEIWDMAAVAYEVLRDTDINDTLACLGIERPDRRTVPPGLRSPRRSTRR